MVFLFYLLRVSQAHRVKKVKMGMSVPWYVLMFRRRIDEML